VLEHLEDEDACDHNDQDLGDHSDPILRWNGRLHPLRRSQPQFS
jgi:hypothetical protein